MNENESLTVTLTLENNEELECAVLNIFEAEEKEYIALLPPDEEGGEESPVYIYRYTQDADGEPGLESIEDDEEYDAVCDAYDEWLDTMEYEALDLDALGLDSLE